MYEAVAVAVVLATNLPCSSLSLFCHDSGFVVTAAVVIVLVVAVEVLDINYQIYPFV
jgi:hypothetical protein